jgi:hypothetical protein
MVFELLAGLEGLFFRNPTWAVSIRDRPGPVTSIERKKENALYVQINAYGKQRFCIHVAFVTDAFRLTSSSLMRITSACNLATQSGGSYAARSVGALYGAVQRLQEQESVVQVSLSVFGRYSI